MKKVLALLVFCFWGIGVFGQKIIISDKISVRDDYAFYLLGKQNDQYLLFRDKGSDFRVQAFNARLAKAWDKKIDLDGRRTEVIDAFGGDDGTFYVLYQYRKKSNTFLKIHQYDAAAELIDTVIIKNYGVRFNTPFPLVQYSPNRQKILIYHVEKDKEIEAIAFDLPSMKIIWEDKTQLHKDLTKKYLFQPVFTDEGKAFFAYEINNRKSKIKKHRFIIHAKNRQGKHTSTVPAFDFLTADYQFVYDPIHHQLKGVGLYASRNVNRSNGIFMFDVPDGAQGTLSLTIHKAAFSNQTIASLAGKTNKKSRGAEDLTIENVLVRSDGGALLMMEKVRVFHRSSIEMPGHYRRSNPSRMSTDYYFEDVLALSIDADGRADWKTMLYKEQTSQNDEGIFSSYFLWQNNNAVRLIFNDEIKRRTNIIEYKLGTNGKALRKSLFNTSGADLLLRMKDGLQISANETIFPSQYKKKLRLVLLKY